MISTSSKVHCNNIQIIAGMMRATVHLNEEMTETEEHHIICDLVEECEKLRMLFDKKSNLVQERQSEILSEISQNGYELVSTISKYVPYHQTVNIGKGGSYRKVSVKMGMIIYLEAHTVKDVETAHTESPAKLKEMIELMWPISSAESTVNVNISYEDYIDAMLYFLKGKCKIHLILLTLQLIYQ